MAGVVIYRSCSIQACHDVMFALQKAMLMKMKREDNDCSPDHQRDALSKPSAEVFYPVDPVCSVEISCACLTQQNARDTNAPSVPQTAKVDAY